MAGLRKMPFFCRLEMGFLLRAQKLRRFLIGRLAIRKFAIGRRLVYGGDAALCSFRSFLPAVVMAAITPNASLPYVHVYCKDFLCVNMDTLSRVRESRKGDRNLARNRVIGDLNRDNGARLARLASQKKA